MAERDYNPKQRIPSNAPPRASSSCRHSLPPSPSVRRRSMGSHRCSTATLSVEATAKDQIALPTTSRPPLLDLSRTDKKRTWHCTCPQPRSLCLQQAPSRSARLPERIASGDIRTDNTASACVASSFYEREADLLQTRYMPCKSGARNGVEATDSTIPTRATNRGLASTSFPLKLPTYHISPPRQPYVDIRTRRKTIARADQQQAPRISHRRWS